MQIGELAALVGVSPRAVRHYHRRGLLPEPARRANGYRDYGLREAIALARIRRLAELGLSLDEVHDALADDRGRDLPEILVELDGDLAEQEQRIRDRRARLAILIERTKHGGVPTGEPVSDGVAALLGDLDLASSDRPVSTIADNERELLALMDTTAEPAQRDRVVATMRRLAADPSVMSHEQELHQRLDELSEASVDDRRVAPLAEQLADSIPAELIAALPQGELDANTAFGGAVFDSLAPAQAEVLRRALSLVGTRMAGRTERRAEP